MIAKKKNSFSPFSRIFKKFRPYYSYFDYYESLIDQISYENLISKLSGKNINNINSSTDITFFSFPFNTDISQVIKKIGAPRHKLKNPQVSNFVTFFYRKKLANIKITVVMHFFKDRLIMGSYIFDSYNPTLINDFESQIRLKYLPEHSPSNAPLIITDSNLNRIEIVHNVDYRINFIYGNQSVLSTLMELKQILENTANVNVKLAYENFI